MIKQTKEILVRKDNEEVNLINRKDKIYPKSYRLLKRLNKTKEIQKDKLKMIIKIFKKFSCNIIYLIVKFLMRLPLFKKFQLVEINALRVSNLIMETEIFYRESKIIKFI